MNPAAPSSSATPPTVSPTASLTTSKGGAWNKFQLKIKYSFYSMLVFVIFANPETFRIMNNMLGKTIPIATSTGLPTATGFFLHSFLFFATMLGLMMLPAE
jgi:hypothetical protein